MSLSNKQESGECPACECKHRDEYYYFRFQDVKKAIQELKEKVEWGKNHGNGDINSTQAVLNHIKEVFGEELVE